MLVVVSAFLPGQSSKEQMSAEYAVVRGIHANAKQLIRMTYVQGSDI